MSDPVFIHLIWHLLITYMHLWSTATQQINKCRIEGHDGIAHVDGIIFLFIQHATAVHISLRPFNPLFYVNIAIRCIPPLHEI